MSQKKPDEKSPGFFCVFYLVFANKHKAKNRCEF